NPLETTETQGHKGPNHLDCSGPFVSLCLCGFLYIVQLNRNYHHELRTLFIAAPQLHITTVREEYIPSDRQAHACSCDLVPYIMAAVELIKNPRALGFRKRLTFVAHGDHNILSR